MSVEIDPAELGFHRPFTTEVSQTLKIRNPNHVPVAFKVKTTAPKQYCVRPNSGRIEPGNEVKVTVLLQAMKQEPPLDAKCRDKFLVQSVAVTPDKEFALGSIWQHVDNADKSLVQEKKIRVVFLPALDSGVHAPGAAPAASHTPQKNGINGQVNDAAPPAYRSPSPQETFTPQQRKDIAGPASTLESEPVGNKHLGDAKASAPSPETSYSSVRNSATSAVAAVSNSVPTSYDDLKAQLAQARATIASFSQDGGLKMRKAAGVAGEGNSETTEVAAQQPTIEGVSIQTVAVLCLLSFLLAYLFF